MAARDCIIDLRAKICPRTHAVLTAEAMAVNRDLAEIVRHVLDSWAAERIRAATLTLRLAGGEGNPGETRVNASQNTTEQNQTAGIRHF